MFLVHTYLSVFAKFIAYAVITKKPVHDERETLDVLTGKAFERLNVERFVEDDFFHWVSSESFFLLLKPMFRELNRKISEYDFEVVEEDILKGLYQELIDLDTRHALGEYYTPDWLCEMIVERLPMMSDSRILDPACGSGSFLRAVVARFKRDFEKITAETISGQVVGIDIHPLSVQISKTTLLLALGDLIQKSRKPVTLHIYLANSLLVPKETADLFKSSFKITVDNVRYTLDISGLTGPNDFDLLVTICDDLVHRYDHILERADFLRLAERFLPAKRSQTLANELYAVYRGMKIALAEGRDSIWKFILQNSYKPVFLRNRFDIVVGNPPWLTYSAVKDTSYQETLKKIADEYKVTPSQANLPHLEIAALFLAHSVNYFLKSSGVIVFVLPRSFMSADQHENIRRGLVEGVQIKSVWDLEGVSPLFRVPSSVFFAQHRAKKEKPGIPETGIPGLKIEGTLPSSHVHFELAKKRLSLIDTCWYYSRLQGGRKETRSALSDKMNVGSTGINAYLGSFTQGATIVPRSFYFIDVDQDVSKGNLSGRTIHIGPRSPARYARRVLRFEGCALGTR